MIRWGNPTHKLIGQIQLSDTPEKQSYGDGGGRAPSLFRTMKRALDGAVMVALPYYPFIQTHMYHKGV